MIQIVRASLNSSQEVGIPTPETEAFFIQEVIQDTDCVLEEATALVKHIKEARANIENHFSETTQGRDFLRLGRINPECDSCDRAWYALSAATSLLDSASSDLRDCLEHLGEIRECFP